MSEFIITHKLWIKQSVYRFFFCLFLGFCFCISSAHAKGAQSEKTVLLLHSYHPGLSWTDGITSAITQTFQDSGQPIQLHVEYLDAKRFPDDIKYREDYLPYKLSQIKFDLVILADNNAYNFVLKHRNDIFSGKPIVFCGVNGFLPTQIEPFNDITGVAETPALVDTLKLIQQLHPQVKEIVIAGTTKDPTGKLNFEQFVMTEQLFSQLKFTYLKDMFKEEILKQVSELKQNQVLFIFASFKNRKGHFYGFTDAAQLLRQASPVPLYGSWDFFLGHGILGGKLINGMAQGQSAARIALQVLNGVDPDTIPVVSTAGTRFMFDYDELKRFNIGLDQLPEDRVIINQPSSFYNINKKTVWIVAGSASFLLLIGLLLIRQMISLNKAGVALKESEERYRSLFNNNHSIMLLIDPETAAIVAANPAACNFYGYTKDTLTQMKISDINTSTKQQIFDEMESAKKEPRNLCNYQHRLASGDIRDVEIYSGPIRMQGKQLLYSTIYDISERKKMEKQHLELEIQLRQKYKMEAVGVMAGGMAHNFNNNLSIILGNIELLKMKMSPISKVDDYLNNAQIAILRSRDLVKQILTYSRQDMKDKTLIQLPLIIDETMKLLHSTMPTTINLHHRISSDSHALMINADPSQVQECLVNLCNNAMHAMEEVGELTIALDSVELQKHDISAQYECQPGRYVKLSVQDTGVGMSAETVDKIFDLFYTTKPVDEGTGVGLSTVQGIVSQYGGLIKVNSRIGEGTTFELYFPVTEQTQVAESITKSKDMPEGKEHILFVDDDPMLANLGEQMLTIKGYTVSTMTNSIEALKLFRDNPDRFDLVITDQTMPELTGKQLIQEIKDIRSTIPAIICTGYSSKIDEEKAAKLGASAFLMKPLSMSQLLQTVRQVLDEKES